MWYAVRRLALGLCLIVLAAAVLLVADRKAPVRSRQVPVGGVDYKPRLSAGEKDSSKSPITKKWNIRLIKYVEESTADAVEDGFASELDQLGLAHGKDYDLKVNSAQKDMPTLIALIDDARSGADLIVCLSTPTLQTALPRVRDLPIVFSNVGAPLAAGAGKSFADHKPNVTGVSVMSDFEGMVKVLGQCLPNARRVGVLFTPSETNSVVYKDALDRACRDAGLELVAVAVTSSSDVPEGCLALLAKSVDAVCQISDNTVTPAFGGVVAATRSAKVPLFSFVSPQAGTPGSAVVLARDYEQAGRDAARQAVRIMRGESPAQIPIQLVSKTVLIVNLRNAAYFKVTVPPALIEKADKVIH